MLFMDQRLWAYNRCGIYRYIYWDVYKYGNSLVKGCQIFNGFTNSQRWGNLQHWNFNTRIYKSLVIDNNNTSY